jgi:plastocyanin
MVTDAAGYQQLIDAARVYADAWRARKAFRKQFRHPRVDQVFLSYTFTKAGTYSYYCSVHPKMTGQVVVK